MTLEKSYSIRWWLVRHAPVINPNDVVYGSMDLDAGFEGMESRITFLRQILPTAANIRTSALVRSQQTLKAVWPTASVNADPVWNEQSLGAWEGRPKAQIYGPDGPVRDLLDDPYHYRPPNSPDGERIGEGWHDLLHRVVQGLTAAESNQTSRDEIVFCHAGTIRAVIAHCLALEPERAFGFVVDNMSLTRIDSVHFVDKGLRQHRWRVAGINLGPAS